MNPHRKFKNHNLDNALFMSTMFVIAIAFCGTAILNTIHKKNIQKLSEEPPLIVCSFCKGKGERPTDVNKLMMDAKLALFINKHLMVDKCDKCVKLPYGDVYDYCDTIQNKYRILLQEYGAAGPKIEMASCEKCMGMGTFSSKDLSTGKWNTQEDWDKKHKK